MHHYTARTVSPETMGPPNTAPKLRSMLAVAVLALLVCWADAQNSANVNQQSSGESGGASQSATVSQSGGGGDAGALAAICGVLTACCGCAGAFWKYSKSKQDSSATAQRVPVQPAGTGGNFCTGCGAQLPAGAKFCAACGTSQGP